MKKFLFLVFFLAIAQVALPIVYTVETIPDTKTYCKDCFVTNPDSILSDSCVARLDEILTELERITSVEFAVVTVDSIDTEDEYDFAVKLFNHRGFGKAGKDNGLLFLHIRSLRAVKIEVGYGLEGDITDAFCSRLLDNYVYPAFREDNFDKGISDAVQIIYEALTSEEILQKNFVNKIEADSYSSNLLCNYIIISLCLLIFFVWRVYARSNKKGAKREDLYKRTKDVSIWCFVFGVAFPVLLVFGFWVRSFAKRQRRKNLICKKCGQPMRFLSEAEEDKYLSSTKQLEEKLKSVDYDVWLCDNCHEIEEISFERTFPSYAACPKCKAKTYKCTNKKTIEAATTSKTGTAIDTYTCQNCKYTKKVERIIPMLTSSSGSGSGGRGSSGGGGGSWGGGRSGGGGAGGRY